MINRFIKRPARWCGSPGSTEACITIYTGTTTPVNDQCSGALALTATSMVQTVTGDAIATEELVERRKMDLALNLVDQYMGLLSHWHWGDADRRVSHFQGGH